MRKIFSNGKNRGVRPSKRKFRDNQHRDPSRSNSSISSKMSNNSFSTAYDKKVSHEIINFSSIFELFILLVVCKKCGGKISVKKSFNQGLAFKIKIECFKRDDRYIDSCVTSINKKSTVYDMNSRLIFVMQYLGVGYACLRKIGIDILLEFLEVTLHSILYYRKLYPEQIFIKKKIYGINIYISQHPKLNDYINNILISVKKLIQQDENNLKSINLLYFNEYHKPIEKFMLHLDQLQVNLLKSDPYFIKIEEVLKTVCLNLSILEIYLKPLPINSSFMINIVTNYAAYTAFIENSICYEFSWIIDDNPKDPENSLLMPINNFKINYLELQLYVIEDKSKNINH